MGLTDIFKEKIEDIEMKLEDVVYDIKYTDKTTKGLFKAVAVETLLGLKVLMERIEFRKALFLNVIKFESGKEDTK